MTQQAPTLTGTLKLLAEMPMFRNLTPTQLNDIARWCQVRRLVKGEPVYCQGDTPRALYHLVEGQIKRVVTTPDGGEKVLEVLNPVQSFGEAELFAPRPYASHAEAVQPSVVLQIGKDAVLRMIAQDPQFSLQVLTLIAERQSAMERDVAARQVRSGSARVMDYLLDLAGDELSSSGDTMLELRTSKQLIASRLDLTPESLSRAFRSLSDARLISVRGRRVTIHRPAGSASARAARGSLPSLASRGSGMRLAA